jgi:predicted small lipoprotein YifL
LTGERWVVEDPPTTIGVPMKTTFSMMLSLAALVLAGCGGSSPPPSDPSAATTTTTDATKDTDGDGVPDSADKCPDKKEDGASPDPKDGCPKP